MAIMDYAVKLTVSPAAMTRDDTANLHSHGLDDTGVLQVTLIAAWFNYINRAADALGVGRE